MAGKLDGIAIVSGSITSTQLDNSLNTSISQGGGPKVTQIQITDSGGTVLDDTAVSTSGGYIKITGTGFSAGATVIVGSSTATSTTFVSSTVLTAQVGAAVAGTYVVYVVNTDGGTATAVNGLTYSAEPVWVTGSTLTSGTSGIAYSNQLDATEATTYTLQAGSSLPDGLTLTSGGLLSGTVTVGSQTVYSFTIVATDAQFQESPRTFSLTVDTIGFRYDSYAANLLWATTFTDYSSSITGGAYADVGPLIRTNQSIAAGTTRNPNNNGNGSISSAVASPFSNYTNNLLFANASSTSNLLYWTYTLNLGSPNNATIEAWFYQASTNSSNFSTFATNAFSGGYYNGVSAYANNDGTVGMFTNYGSSAASAASQFTKNNWFHLAYVFSSGAMSIYLNGTRIVNSGSGSGGGGTVAFGGTSWDGLGNATSRAGWRMQDLRVYNIAKYSGASFSLSLTNPDFGGSILI
jgi:hypothetical protein